MRKSILLLLLANIVNLSTSAIPAHKLFLAMPQPDGDGNVTIGDVTGVIDIILGNY